MFRLTAECYYGKTTEVGKPADLEGDQVRIEAGIRSGWKPDEK